jgi:gas vesicle protein
MANRGGEKNMESYDRFESENGSGGTFVMGLLAGTVLGASLGMLFAPKSGSELRSQLSEKAGNLANSAKDGYSKAQQFAQEGYQRATDVVNEGYNKVNDGYKQVADVAKDGYNKAASAAKEGYKSATEGTGGNSGSTGSSGSSGSTGYPSHTGDITGKSRA